MKKLLLIIGLSLTAVACNKEKVMRCTYTNHVQNVQSVAVYTGTKKELKAAKETIESGTANASPNGDLTCDCEITNN
jgi:hypothetical protein